MNNEKINKTNHLDILKCAEIFYNNSKIQIKCLICDEHLVDGIIYNVSTLQQIEFFNHIFHHFENESKLNNQLPEPDLYSEEEDTDIKPSIQIEFIGSNLNSNVKDDNSNSLFSLPDTTDIEQADDFDDTTNPIDDSEDKDNDDKLVDVLKPVKKLNEKNSRGLYSCPDCDKEFICYTSIFRHRRENHDKISNNPPVLPFDILNAGYTKGMKITFEKSEDGFYHCSQCIFKSQRAASLRQHIRLHIASEKCVCQTCGKVFSATKSLREHIKIHTGEKPYKCEYCGKSFSNRSNWANHVRIHTQEKRYECDYCDKRFIQRTEKIVHERIHLNDRRYVCEICSKQFVTMQKLKIHIRRHNKIKNYECDICKKSFYTNHELREHKVIHSNTRPHKCDICGKGFASSSTLRSHKYIHSDVKNYACRICDQKFAQRSGLYCHYKIHTKPST